MKKLTLISIVALSINSALADSFKASELYNDLHPDKKAAITKEMEEKGISEEELEEIEIEVNKDSKNINISGASDIKRKHALFVALRLGFPLVAGAGIVYRNQGIIPFNVTLNVQTIILATSYNAGIAWNFYKGFFVGVTGHMLKTYNVWGGDNGTRFFPGIQAGYQHSFGKNDRWYIDGRIEVLKSEDNYIPNANLGFGVRFW